jgi:hypothetical protein
MVRSKEHGALVLGRRGTRRLRDGVAEGENPLASFGENAASHLLRSDGFDHAPDIWVNSFYDPDLDEACAFEEQISFHGGLGGPQTRPFPLAPTELSLPDGPIVRAVATHELLKGWRQLLQHPEEPEADRYVASHTRATQP